MSREITLETEKAKLEKKFWRQLGGGDQYEKLITEHENMTKEQLEERLLNLAKTQQGIINTRNSDTKLNRLKDEVREQSRTYNDQVRSNKELARYVSLVISDRFGDDLMDQKTTNEEND